MVPWVWVSGKQEEMDYKGIWGNCYDGNVHYLDCGGFRAYKTHYMVHFKYVRCIVHQLYLIKAVKRILTYTTGEMLR